MSEKKQTNRIVYHKVEAYPMKLRLYLTSEQKATFDEWLAGLSSAYNMTLDALRAHNPAITRLGTPGQQGDRALFPDFHAMAKKDWLDTLRERDDRIKDIPGACLSNQVSGLFCGDMRMAWTRQGKYPVDVWFSRTDRYGQPIVRYYDDQKRRRSAYLQIHANSFTLKSRHVVLVRVPKLGVVKLRGWNHKIAYAPEGEPEMAGRGALNGRESENGLVSFFDHFRDSRTLIGCRIEKDRCGDYYMILSLKDVYRPFQVIDDPAPRDIEIHVDGNGTLITSDGQKAVTPPGVQQGQDHISHLRQQLSSQYGPANKRYRDDRRKAKKYNKKHQEEIREGTEKPQVIHPSNNYQKTGVRILHEYRSIQRRNELSQHEFSASIVSHASSIRVVSSANHTDMDPKASDAVKSDGSLPSRADGSMSAGLQKVHYKAEWSGILLRESKNGMQGAERLSDSTPKSVDNSDLRP